MNAAPATGTPARFFETLRGATEEVSSRSVWKKILPPVLIVILFGLLLAFFTILSRKEGQSQCWKTSVVVTVVAMLLLLVLFFNYTFRTEKDDESQDGIVHEDERYTEKHSSSNASGDVRILRTSPLVMRTTAQKLRRTRGTLKTSSHGPRLSTNAKSFTENVPSTRNTTAMASKNKTPPRITTLSVTTKVKSTAPTAASNKITTQSKTTTATTAVSVTTKVKSTAPTTTSNKATTQGKATTAATTLSVTIKVKSTELTTSNKATTQGKATTTTTTPSAMTKVKSAEPTTKSNKATATSTRPKTVGATTTLLTTMPTKTDAITTTTNTTTTPSATSTTTNTTTRPTTTNPTTTSPTKSTKATELPSDSRGPWLSQTLLCTVNHFITREFVAPDDGLCDFLFFDSLFKNGNYNLGVPYEVGFQHFIEFGRSHVKTQYGAGFSYVYDVMKSPLEQMMANNLSKVRDDIIGLWNLNILHFGYIDIGYIYFDGGSLVRVLSVLQRVVQMLSSKQTVEHPTYTLLAVPMFGTEAWHDELAKAFRTTTYTPNALVAVSHLAEVDFYSGYACRIMPPMFLDKPALPEDLSNENVYKYSMSTTLSDLEKFARLKRPKTALFVTVPLFAKWYTFDGDEYGFNVSCGIEEPPSLFGSVVEVCNNSQYNTTYIATRPAGVVSACRECQMTLVYDNEESYRYKLCTLKANWTALRYGVLALGIDTDDTINSCGRGSYARLRSLRWLVHFFGLNFTTRDKLEDCKRGPE